MKHLLFFYLTCSYSIGFFSFIILFWTYLKSRWKAFIYMSIFWVIGTIQLIFLTYVAYRYANIPFWYNHYYPLINYGLESLYIFVFPLLINELFKVNPHRLVNDGFGILFLCGLTCIVTPSLLGVLHDGSQIESFIGFKIYRLIFAGAFVYSFSIFGLKIKNINDIRERNFYIFTAIILFVLFTQTIVPIVKSFPENTVIFATGYFYLNVCLLKYLVNRFFEFSQPPLTKTVSEIMTPREKEILAQLAQGLSNKDIGMNLSITETTVKTHIQNIYKKLGVSNRVQLINRLRNNNYHVATFNNPK